MIHLIGIGPGDPDLITLKAARLLREADLVYVPQSNREGRSVAESIIAPHANPAKVRPVLISMRRPERGLDPAYARLAAEMSAQAAAGLEVVYVSLGDTLLYSTGQYLGRELEKLGAAHAYVPGISSFTAAASLSGIPLAAGREGLLVHVMPNSLEDLAALARLAQNAAATLVLLKVNKRLPVLLEYVRQYGPARATLLHRIGLEDEAVYQLAGTAGLPADVGYLSIAIIKPVENI